MTFIELYLLQMSGPITFVVLDLDFKSHVTKFK